jgi:aerobic-type carbon monoxide dehydrogenase small subunit (CoxS/CutS family)
VAEHLNVLVRVNGRDYSRSVPARLSLADFLRHELGLYGTHVGCEQGVCGMCTILLDGQPVKSCLLLAAQVEGHEVTTVEALNQSEELHPLQRAFTEAHALQCGFCTPGFLMTAFALADWNPAPSQAELREELAGVLCRCTGYQNILEAVDGWLRSVGRPTLRDGGGDG